MQSVDVERRAQELVEAYVAARQAAEEAKLSPNRHNQGDQQISYSFYWLLMGIIQPWWDWDRDPFATRLQLAGQRGDLPNSQQLTALLELDCACSGILQAEPPVRIACVLHLLPLLLRKSDALSGLRVTNGQQRFAHGEPESEILSLLFRGYPPFQTTDLCHMLRMLRESWQAGHRWWMVPVKEMLSCATRHVQQFGMDQQLLAELTVFRDVALARFVKGQGPWFLPTLDALLGIPIDLGDRWGAVARPWFLELDEPERSAWRTLMEHAKKATSAQPSAAWLARARQCTTAIGHGSAHDTLITLLAFLNAPPPDPDDLRWHDQADSGSARCLTDENASLMRGLIWFCAQFDGPDMAAALSRACVELHKQIPRYGPFSAKTGNAAIRALGAMSGLQGIMQLRRLSRRVRHVTARRLIDQALTTSAIRAGLSREDLDELVVPDYGLVDGRLRMELGGYAAELVVKGPREVEVRWFKADGTPLRSVPAAVKREHKDEVKTLKRTADDIAAALLVHRDRIDGLFLADRSWPLPVWRERYLDHPLLSVLARRLIWWFGEGEGTRAGAWLDGRTVDANDRPLDGLTDETRVRLWHPIGVEPEGVLAWRTWLERHAVRQPFKQAHREVYLLTDAELATGTYSNRFAAHILRQHQFNSLCAARGWRNTLRLMVDDTYPPASKDLPAWGLRAEFWVEGAGTEYGVDTTEAGTYLYVVTDQVRFYRTGAPQRVAHAWGGGYEPARNAGPDTPLPLTEVPALVFSEVMRDVDLFVGVASVANDPTWQDGGPDGRYLDYWQRYSFGDLSASAQTRRAVLERLLPRLKIAERCTLSDKFLVVRGELRTYKIHLGSGNILMEPNDQYLCIVPNRRAEVDAPDTAFLPFEGDGTLAVILSKAFLLADDRAIKDPTITRQIGSG
jgi:hypothetical protein